MSTSDVTVTCPHCLICHKKTESCLNFAENWSIEQRQLFVIYLVNKLLDIPSEICAKYLTNFGNPEQWLSMSICSDCRFLVDEGRELFNHIQRLEKRHKAIGVQIRSNFKIKPEPEECCGQLYGPAAVEIRHYLDMLDYCPLDEEGEPLTSLNEDEEDADDDNGIYKETRRKVSIKRKLRPENFDDEEEEEEIEVKVEEDQDYDPLGDEFMDDLDFDMDSNDAQEFSVPYQSPSPKNTKMPKTKKKSVTPAPKSKKKIETATDEELLSFEQVLEKHEELESKLEPLQENVTYSQEELDQRAKAKESCSITHLAQLYNVKVFPCKMCPYVTNSLIRWHKHWFSKFGTCRKREEKAKAAGIKPIRTLKRKQKFTQMNCPECGITQVDHRDLETHMRKEHFDKDDLRCRGCSKAFTYIPKYTGHYKEALATDPTSPCATNALKCDSASCKDAFRCSQAALDLHVKIYHVIKLEEGQSVHACHKCARLFPRRSDLLLHFKSDHDPSEPRYSCNVPGCSKSYKVYTELTNHILRAHAEKKNFICHICGNAYPTNANLRIHLKRHYPEPCVCNICGKTFKFPKYLKIHMWSHDPEMRHKFIAKNKCAKRDRERQARQLQLEQGHGQGQEVTNYIPL